MAKQKNKRSIGTIRHLEASRRNIPTAEYQPMMTESEQAPVQVVYQHRNRELDPQLFWRGKDDQDWSELVVSAPPLYIQEKVHPKALIDNLMHQSRQSRKKQEDQPDLFADFNGLPNENARTEFYQHDQYWTNRMILGDSLQVMASLAEREGLRGRIQCIYLDPPYGIKFNSNFQWSTTSRDVQDGRAAHITREPEQVKAFRDTWRDGIHSYLTYLRDRLTVARDLLTESGSIFLQIGDENVHLVRILMDEVFGSNNFVSLITYRTSSGTTQHHSVKRISDYLVWYCKNKETVKFRRLLRSRDVDTRMYNQIELRDGFRRSMSKAERQDPTLCPKESKPFQKLPLHSMASGDHRPRSCFGTVWRIPPTSRWRYAPDGFTRIFKASRIQPDRTALRAIYYHNDYPASEITNTWNDTGPEINKSYVVQTSTRAVQRCILMTTDPGDLVLDPTCGSGTTAYVAEQWGRRWITIDTSRVALALARARIMGARFPYYLLTDSREGRRKEAELTGKPLSDSPTHSNIRQGFVYKRVPHITLRSIAHNTEIDVIWDTFKSELEPLRSELNEALGTAWEEWEIPRDNGSDWSEVAKRRHEKWWAKRLERQKKIDTAIAAKADQEFLYDDPYEDNRKVRVAGPFTVESTSPHRMLAVNGSQKSQREVAETQDSFGQYNDFAQIILENLKTAGIQQAHKKDKISFSSITPWPGKRLCAEGVYWKGNEEKGSIRRAAIFVGPEFGTVSRADLVSAVREAADGNFDILISCAFNYDAYSNELDRLGRIPILRARMNADLHMAEDFKNTGTGNLFFIFGEPDIDLIHAEKGKIRIKVNGVDVFQPSTGEIRSDEVDGIACWFIDTDYNEESFIVRHAYFLGAGDPFKSLKTTLKAEISLEAWAALNSNVSLPFDKPQTGRIAVKVINHLGDEVMKVFDVN